jgi:protein O-GlcNAc transferase
MTDGARIVVPNSLNLITPYVLFEQLDWFEDEIKFLRRVLLPGHKVIDIGANYGVYTLSMAKTVGPTGSVWAFEPASRTAELLMEGIAANEFSHVVLEKSALSSGCGTAQLTMNDHAELNSLVQSEQASEHTETVTLVTLDDCLTRYGWNTIDFMKIDAEGEEARILAGGRKFLSQLSPLILYEVRAGVDLHLGLAADFAAQGYSSYRLVPGLDLLVSFDPGAPPDGYLLNLFCCKRQRAEQLAADGFLIDAASGSLSAAAERVEALCQLTSREYSWEQTIAQLPYGLQFSARWQNWTQTGDGVLVDRALACYAISRDFKLPATERFVALERALAILAGLCHRQPSASRLFSLARVAREFGARSIALMALNQLSSTIAQTQAVDFDEPFLTPAGRFDSIAPGGDIGNWVLASMLESIEELNAYSSFYSGKIARERLELIAKFGFGSEEMARRLRMVTARFGETTPIN